MNSKDRLDKELVARGLVSTRSQAENYIKLGKVKVNGRPEIKPGFLVKANDELFLDQEEQYVSRAGLKLASIVPKLELDFKDKLVLDVGSSTGGFTDYSLKHGARKVIAIDVGTNQLHPSLQTNSKIELHEQTDIRDFNANEKIDTILIDVSFVSLREILPAITKLADSDTQIVAMVKPQFEAGAKDVNKGVVKNDKLRRQILKDFESWSRSNFVVIAKADSEISGSKGNLERFYLLKKQG